MEMIKKISIIGLIIVGLSLILSSAAIAQDTYDWEDYYGTSEDAAFLFGLGITVCLVLLVIPLVIAIIAAIWIYKDAEKRGKSGVLWVILLIVMSLVLSFIGFIIIIVVWLATRPPIGGEPKTNDPGTGRMCPSCGRPIPMDARVCPYCGKNFDQQ